MKKGKIIRTNKGRHLPSGQKWELTWHGLVGSPFSTYAEIYIYDGATDKEITYAQFNNKTEALRFLSVFYMGEYNEPGYI